MSYRNFGKRFSAYFLKLCYSRLIRTIFYEDPIQEQDGLNRSRNILVLRTDGLGDLILSLPLFRHIKRVFGEARVVVVTREEWKSILQTCPYVDEVISWNIRKYARSLRYRMDFIRSLRKRIFGTVVHPVYSREPLSDEVACCVRDTVRIGFDGDLNNINPRLKKINDGYYSQLIRDASLYRPELERNCYFADRLLDDHIAPGDFQPELWISDSDRATAREILFHSGIEPDLQLVIALFPGASAAYKTWPWKNFVELANRLSRHFSVKLITCGSSTDVPIVSELACRINGPVVNLAGKTSLAELAAVLECSGLYIGNDTGPLHMAAAVGTPTLAIMGGGHFGRFYPYGDLNKHRMVFKKLDCYGCNWKCIYETTRCIEEITVDDVWREAQRMMEEVVLPSRVARNAKRQGKMVLST